MKAYGTFTKIGEHVYRTDTYLQFGDSYELIGAPALCNPGSARVLNESIEEKLINYNEDETLKFEGIELNSFAILGFIGGLLKIDAA